MKLRWILPFLCLGLLLAGCGSQVSPTPVRPPTSVPRTDVAPTPAADPFARPEMTAQGQMEDGTPVGVTANGRHFKGDPNAPVVLFEFSDFQ